MSTLKERNSAAENETKGLQEKVKLLTEGKTASENEMALLKESLQTLEKEKQVGHS